MERPLETESCDDRPRPPDPVLEVRIRLAFGQLAVCGEVDGWSHWRLLHLAPSVANQAPVCTGIANLPV
jgi:hypothetical protein